jgi:hypothetical protein
MPAERTTDREEFAGIFVKTENLGVSLKHVDSPPNFG